MILVVLFDAEIQMSAIETGDGDTAASGSERFTIYEGEERAWRQQARLEARLFGQK